MRALSPEDVADLRRWSLSALAILLLSGGLVAAATLRGPPEALVAAEPAGAIAVDFAPDAAAPSRDVTAIAPGPEQTASESVPTPIAVARPADEPPIPDLPRVTNPDVALAPKVEETIAQPEPARVAAAATSAPVVVADRTAPVAVAPREGVPDPLKSEAVATWRTQLLATVERNKRYPAAARSRRQQGVATVAFTLDRAGRVVEARLVRSSGASLLDDEAMALLRRAEPFPAPPVIVPGERVAVNLPIRFATK